MKASLLFASLLLSFFSRAQVQILHDPVSARTFNSEKYSGINGSSFLFDNWTTGSVTVKKGIYKNVQVKFDAYSNILYFNKNDELYEFEDAVQSFILMHKPSDSSTYQYFKSGLSGDGLRAGQFVVILLEGKINLYRADTKQLTEVNETNRGRIKTFTDATRYYVLHDDKIKEIKLAKNDVLEQVKDKEQQIQSYIESNKLSTKKNSDLIQILKYYNSL